MINDHELLKSFSRYDVAISAQVNNLSKQYTQVNNLNNWCLTTSLFHNVSKSFFISCFEWAPSLISWVGNVVLTILFELIMKPINKYSLDYAESWNMYYNGEKLCLGGLNWIFRPKIQFVKVEKNVINFLLLHKTSHKCIQ